MNHTDQNKDVKGSFHLSIHSLFSHNVECLHFSHEAACTSVNNRL